MGRIGQNPMKWVKEVHHPEKITVTTAVHIPFIGGFWEHCLEVLKLCLQSMRENTRIPFDLIVLDNNSCKEVKDYLLGMKANGKIQYLVLSEHNIGRVGSMNFVLNAAPGEVVSFTDSDVYFLPGWLEETTKVLKAFPEAGMITAQPIVGGILKSGSKMCEIAENDPSISFRRGDLIPEEYTRAHLIGLGTPPEDFYRKKDGREDLLITRGEVSAYASGSHFQFITTKEVIRSLPIFKAVYPLGDDNSQWDDAIAALNYWRLATTKYLSHHMGNRTPALEEELAWLDGKGLPPKAAPGHKPPKRSNFLQREPVRAVLKKINSLTYNLLYGKD